jgi:cyclophilin family peptidyl-prolyl cis-trans isomerase
MKLGRKAILSIVFIVVLTTSGLIAWTQFFGSQTEIVVLETTLGNIEIELDRQHAPLTVENFVSYVKSGFYDGTIFHRVYPGFVIQGGGYTTNSTEKATKAPIKLESNNGLKNTAGTIAMARTNVADSAMSQFFINLVNNNALDYASSSNPGYAVFGKVVSGMDVVDKIAKVETGTKDVYLPDYNMTYPFEDWPVQDIIITRAYMKP